MFIIFLPSVLYSILCNLLRNCKHNSVFEIMDPALESIQWMVPMPKERCHTEKAALLDKAFCTALL